MTDTPDPIAQQSNDWMLEKLMEWQKQATADGSFFAAMQLEQIAGRVKQQAALLGECAKMLRSVTLDEMGGTPDLFCPTGGWDAFEIHAKGLLAKLEAKP